MLLVLILTMKNIAFETSNNYLKWFLWRTSYT